MYVRMVADDSITSNTIRFVLHEMFSHVGFKLDDETWLDCRLGGGVQIRPADSVKDTRHLDFTFPGVEKAAAFGKTLIGTPYDVGNIFNFLDPGWPINRHQLICSRFVRLCAREAGFPLINPAISDYQVAPAHFIYPVGVVPGVTELDRWPRDLLL